MKKFICFIVCLISLTSCTENERARNFGGTQTIKVEKGMRVVEATWKDEASLWYLVEPMDDDYTPKTKKFIEDSRFGCIEGEVVFVESR